MHITARSMNEAYRKLCLVLYSYGDDVEARGLKTRELTDVTIELKRPRDRVLTSPTRSMSMRYMVGEMCFYLNGDTVLDHIAHYGPFWRKVSDDGETVNSAYGHRLFYYKQFDYVMAVLQKDASSRKAVLPIYNWLDAKESKDNPCTMFIQLLIRKGKLDCYVRMRSNDVWLGLPYDAAFFTLLQEIALVVLQRTYPSLVMGTYYHNATSMHCYEEHVEDLWRVRGECGLRHIAMPEVTDSDVQSWFSQLRAYEESYREGRRDVILTTGIQGWLAQWLR